MRLVVDGQLQLAFHYEPDLFSLVLKDTVRVPIRLNDHKKPFKQSAPILTQLGAERRNALLAEQAGLEFLLSMVKWRGFGGDTNPWDYSLESFSLMAACAAVTSRIQLYASVAIPTIHPGVIAKMASTIDDISRDSGRCNQSVLRMMTGDARITISPPFRIHSAAQVGRARTTGMEVTSCRRIGG